MKFRKKMVGIVLVLALMVSAVCVSLVGYGAEPSGEAEANRNYLKQDVKLLDKDFEDLTAGAKYTTNQISSLYLNKDASTESALSISGSKSLKFTAATASEEFGTQVFALDGTGTADFRAAGDYYFKVKYKASSATKLILEVRNKWVDSRDGLIAEYRRGFVYTEGVLTSLTDDSINGFRTVWGETPDINPGYKNELTTVQDGCADAYFEFSIPEGMAWGDGFCPNFAFKAIYPEGAELVFDDIVIGKVGQPAKYFTKNVDCNYDDTSLGNVWDVQPIWANNCGYETELPLSGAASMKIWNPAISDNTQLGGITNNAPGSPKNFSNKIGLYYFQFDINFGSFTDFNFWTSGTDYLSVQYKKVSDVITFKSEGKAINLRALNMGDYFRISFYVNYATENVSHNINASGPAQSELLIDNFMIAQEDYAPYTENASFDRVAPSAVTVNVDNKDKAFEKINVKEGEDLTEDTHYTLQEGSVTFKSDLFIGKTEDFVVEYCTAGGKSEISFSVNDNRTQISQITAEGEIVKTYDGTTDCAAFTGVTYTLTGVSDSDKANLSFTYTNAIFSSKDAGETLVTLSGLTLTGSAHESYKLATDLTVTVKAKINAVKLTVSGTQVALTKVYDGTDTAAVTAVGALEGVIGQDTVNLSASAKFNSKNVSAASIGVLYTIDNANYTAPDAYTISQGVSITKKALSVTADSLEKKAGESDPVLTYQVLGLIAGDTLSGALTRDSGEAVGEYAIKLGTLSNDNYEITFDEGKLKITAQSKKGCGAVMSGGSFTGGGMTAVLAVLITVFAAAFIGKKSLKA